MTWLGYLIIVVCLGLIIWYLIDTIKVAKERIKNIKEKRKKNCATGGTNNDVSKGEVQPEINNKKECDSQ